MTRITLAEALEDYQQVKRSSHPFDEDPQLLSSGLSASAVIEASCSCLHTEKEFVCCAVWHRGIAHELRTVVCSKNFMVMLSPKAQTERSM